MSEVVKAGTADVSVTIRIIDSADGTPETAVEHDDAGIDLWYRRDVDPGGTPLAKISITEVALAALTTAHTDGGIEHIGDGYYRLDVPDAAFAAGARGVLIGGTVTGMVVIGTYISLVDYDPQDGVRLGLTALPNAAADAAGGLLISDSGGLDVDTLDSNISTIISDIGALNNLSAAQVNAELLDVLNTDTFAEPSGVPAATATLATKLGYLYMMLRNRITVTDSKKTFYDDANVAQWEKDLSDDGTTYTETKGNAI